MKASDIDLASITDAVDANADSYALIIENTELRKQQLKKLRYPQILSQGGVPIYILPTGSVAANGAITLGTALLTTESGGMWGYLPAGAAYAASAADFYWMVMSSTTLGTIYNNTYAPGTTDWRIPTTLVAIVDAGPGAYTGVTTEVTAVSVPMAGGSMGSNGSINIRTLCGNNNSVGNKTQRSKLSTTNINTVAATTNLVTGQLRTSTNRGTQSAQLSNTASASDSSNSGSAPLITGVDTSTSVAVAVSLQLATATDWVSLFAWAFEVRYQA